MEHSATYMQKNVSPSYYKLQEYAVGTYVILRWTTIYYSIQWGVEIVLQKWYVTDHTMEKKHTMRL